MAADPETTRVDLLDTIEILTTAVTETLCDSVFHKMRGQERQRKWSLWALVQFWQAVILRSPPSLSQALLDSQQGRHALIPRIVATPEAFFQRCRDFRWEFFAEVFRQFTARVLPQAKPRFCSAWSFLREQFPDVLIIDGSQLAPIARRLKILRNEQVAILPGSILAAYDMFRGIPRYLHFTANAAENEWARTPRMLDEFKPGTLVIGDRLFGTAACFQALKDRDLWGLFPRTTQLSVRTQTVLRDERYKTGQLKESLVCAGKGHTVPKQDLRCISFVEKSKTFTLLTNILDPAVLPAEQALELYRCRWSIERLFYDLKEVLNLNRFYPANPNAIGMQVFSAALVYSAMRIAQANAAEQVALEPEVISPARFFPKMAAASSNHALTMYTIEEIAELNPGHQLKRPDLRKETWSWVLLKDILVVRRKGIRQTRTKKGGWKSFAHVPGGPNLARLS